MSVAAVVDRDAQLPRLLDGDDAQVGLLVEFRKVNKTGLALITEKDGKRNWKAVDSRQESLNEQGTCPLILASSCSGRRKPSGDCCASLEA